MSSHPGPSHSVGRAAPELDVFETIVNPLEHYGEASQTIQVAPFDADYLWHNTTDTSSLGTDWDTEFNAYHGGVFQQVSVQVHRLQLSGLSTLR